MKEKIDKLIQKITDEHDSDDILNAKLDYQKLAGEIYEDDKSYEARMGMFLEWYIFDRNTPEMGKTPLELLVTNNGSVRLPEELQIIYQFTNNIRSLFAIKKIRDNEVVIQDLFDDQKYTVTEKEGKILFHKNDLFEGRIILFDGNYYFSGNFCFHPHEAEKFIKGEIKKIQSIRDGYLKELKTINSQLTKLNSRLDKNAREIEKINEKVKGSNSTDKIRSLNGKLEELKKARAELVQKISMTEAEKSNLEVHKIKIEINELFSHLVQRLGYMNLKWERSRQIDLHDIYCN